MFFYHLSASWVYIVKVAILGAGSGGCATTVDLVCRGFDVTLCSAYRPEHFRHVIEKGSIEYSGKLGNGMVKVKATNSVKDAVKNADIIIITTPSSIHGFYAKLLAPCLPKKHLILLSGCTTGGALNVANILKKAGVSNPIVCETDILSYACRLESPTCVKVHLRISHLLFACFPAKHNEEAYQVISELFPEIESTENVLETSFSNMNAVIHPPGMVLNAGWIEFTKGNFYFYSQGITPAVSRVIDKVDEERLAILRKMGLKQRGILEHEHRWGFSAVTDCTTYDFFQGCEPVRSINSPAELYHRFLIEDVGYGLLPMASVASEINVSTPIIDSLISLSSILTKVDHRKIGLTARKLGIEKMGLRKLRKFLYDGFH